MPIPICIQSSTSKFILGKYVYMMSSGEIGKGACLPNNDVSQEFRSLNAASY